MPTPAAPEAPRVRRLVLVPAGGRDRRDAPIRRYRLAHRTPGDLTSLAAPAAPRSCAAERPL
jgi:hypothetical protein